MAPKPKASSSRGEKTRDAVADALLALIDEGDLRPTAPRIAERAEVSLRLVFHHFRDLEDLFSHAAERQAQRILPTLRVIPATDPLPARIDAIVGQRAKLYERLTNARRASLLMEPFSPTIAGRLEQTRALKRAEVGTVFQRELDALPRSAQRDALATLATVLSFSTWQELRRYQGLSLERTEEIVKNLLGAALRSLSQLALLALVALTAACGPSAPTYHKDIRAIVEQKCASCHTEDGIAPFTLNTYADLASKKSLVRAAVADRVMPPWPAAPGCNDYLADRSLTDEQIDLVTKWIDQGAVEGEPSTYRAPAAALNIGIDRVDQRLALAAPYVPKVSPDDYRCFLIDWPETTTKFVTGFRAAPGNGAIVHHVIAFLSPPENVALYQQLDDAEEGPGYTCFGGPGASNNARWLGSWAPGSMGTRYPVGTGIKVEPGSKVILQLHYNTLTTSAAPDQSAIELRLDDAVDQEAIIQPWTNLGWVLNRTMNIPAGEADVTHTFLFDPSPFMSRITGGVIPDGAGFTVWAAGLHMHTRGTSARFDIVRYPTDEHECMLDIPRWDFHWQGAYGFQKPKTFKPGDELYLECHFNNTSENQPIVNGTRLPVVDVNWGEGTTDEMCLGGIYISP